MATMNVDYERNRNYLLWVFKGCNVPEVKNGCDDMTGTYLAYLYEHGHAEVLKPLMTGLNGYNAAGSEFIGGFLSRLVAKNHADFLNAIRDFPVPEQKEICYFTGLADGGGMSPADLRQARKQLGAMEDSVARRCLQQIEKANRQE
ncbi:MAG TPA: hypothetical protein VHV83_21865 [Armatimonadota bacterium]|nr:hypothetical protein [Armatimonadota bacterium]